jgi:NAD(P)-dependent dehydrogenase (short-subunit alcohol dehydrogenase family)
MATVLITGGGSGIGAATARAFAARGDTVHVADLDLAAAEKVAAEIGGKAHEVDVSDRSAMAALAAEVGAVDVLVNNAGVGMTGRFTAMTEADWDWIRGVNLDGVVNGCAAFGPAMLDAGRGHVVNLSSGLGYTPTATEPAYVTTKAAVLALSRCLRADWRAQGVGVTAVCPGVINTPIIDRTRFLGDQDDPTVRRRTTRLFRRGHKPEAVATAIVKAVDRNRAVVPVGVEAWLGWGMHRYLPVRLQEALGRLGRR